MRGNLWKNALISNQGDNWRTYSLIGEQYPAFEARKNSKYAFNCRVKRKQQENEP